MITATAALLSLMLDQRCDEKAVGPS